VPAVQKWHRRREAIASLEEFFKGLADLAADQAVVAEFLVTVKELGDPEHIGKQLSAIVQKVPTLQEWMANLPPSSTELLDKGRAWLETQQARIMPFVVACAKAVCLYFQDCCSAAVPSSPQQLAILRGVFPKIKHLLGAPTDYLATAHEKLSKLASLVDLFAIMLEFQSGESPSFADQYTALKEATEASKLTLLKDMLCPDMLKAMMDRAAGFASASLVRLKERSDNSKIFKADGEIEVPAGWDAAAFESAVTEAIDLADTAAQLAGASDATAAELSKRKDQMVAAHEAFIFKAVDKLYSDAFKEADRLVDPIEEAAIESVSWSAFIAKLAERSQLDNVGLVQAYQSLQRVMKQQASASTMETAKLKSQGAINVLCVVSAAHNLGTVAEVDGKKAVDSFKAKVESKGGSFKGLPELVRKRCAELDPESAEPLAPSGAPLPK
jgi:hypothetical protein